jgi:hypothetical protein
LLASLASVARPETILGHVGADALGLVGSITDSIVTAVVLFIRLGGYISAHSSSNWIAYTMLALAAVIAEVSSDINPIA